jgi:hypothetical protein
MPLDPVRRLAASLTRWERLALAAWGIVLTFVCVRTAIWSNTHTCYPIFALASRNWLAGVNLYGPTQYDIYRYSPLVAAAFIPLGFLPNWLGGVLWRLVSTAVYTAALIWWCRFMAATGSAPNACPNPNPNPNPKIDGFGQGQKSQSRNRLAILFLLVLPLSFDNLNNGQSNLLMIGLIILSILACGTELWSLAAVCAAAACLLKVYPVVIAMLLSAAHPRRFAPRFVIALAVGILLPFVLQRPSYVVEQYQSWAHHLVHGERDGLSLQLWYRDLRVMARVCGIHLTAPTYAMIQAMTGTSIAAICLAARRRGWPRHELALLVLGLGSCWMTVFGVAAETSTYVIVAPVASWCVVDAWRRQLPLVERSAYLGVYLLFGLARAAGSNEYTRSLSIIGQPATSLLFLGLLSGTAPWRLRWNQPAASSDAVPSPARAA